MPQATADVPVASEVTAPSLRVISTAKLALGDTKSDFRITVRYTLFDDKLDIANNPAFVEAMQLSCPDRKPN